MADESSTVRVELSGDIDDTTDVASLDGAADDPRTGLTLIVLTVATLFVLAFVPSLVSGDPTPVAAPEPVDQRSARQPLDIDVPPTSGGERADVAAPDPRLFEVDSIRRNGDGFLALLGGVQSNALPRLLTSRDGTRWLDVDIVRPGLDITPAGLDRRYSDLIATTSGFAMLETIVGSLDEPSDVSGAPVRVRRWVSEDGEHWILDPALAPIESPAGKRLGVWDHTEESIVAFAVGDDDQRLLATLLDTWIVDGALSGGTCQLDGSGGLDLAVFTCTAGPRIILSTADLVEPVTMHQLLACATELRGGRFQVFDLFASTTWADDVVVSRNLDQSLVGWHPIGVDAALVFDGGSSGTFEGSTCDGLLDLDAQRPPSLTIRRGGAVDTELALPGPMSTDFDRAAIGRASRVVGDSYFTVVGSSVWSLALDSGEWTPLFELAETSGDTSVEFSDDARFIVESDPGSVTRIDLSDGSRQVAGGLRSARDRVLHFDETSVFLLGQNGLSVVDWADAALVGGGSN